MKQTLRQRIGTGIVWLGGLASLTGMSGCETQTIYKTPEQIQQEQIELEKASRLAGGLLFGMAGSGAFDSPNRTVQQNLAVRGAASGMQQYQMNDAIRDSGQVNVYNNQNDQKLKYINFINLDTGKSIQIPGWDEEACMEYVRSQKGSYPKKGYLTQKMYGNESLNRGVLILKDE